jgi:hypothetical protein
MTHPFSIESLDTHELAWAAGLFDGEGSTYVGNQIRPDRPRNGKVLRMALTMTDFESVRRFHAALGGLGQVVGPYPLGKTQLLPQIRWQVGSFEYAQMVIAILWRWLGPAKREQARRCMAEIQEHQIMLRPFLKTRRRKDFCKQGHDLSLTRYTAPGGGSYCRTCNNDRRLARLHGDAPLFNTAWRVEQEATA